MAAVDKVTGVVFLFVVITQKPKEIKIKKNQSLMSNDQSGKGRRWRKWLRTIFKTPNPKLAEMDFNIVIESCTTLNHKNKEYGV